MTQDGVQVGKCSSSITRSIAQDLLVDGVPYVRDPIDAHPYRIYNVYEGVPYEARPTEIGVSYHGYPWCGTMPRRILRQLEARATDAGHGRAFKRWLQDHSRMHK